MSKQLFCIVGTGRSGSSLLAAIIANSGGNFGLPAQVDWDSEKGSMEHPLCHVCYSCLSRISKLKESILPQNIFGISIMYSRFKRKLLRLQAVDFVKSSTLIWIVPYLRKVGISPTIIISFRDFESFAFSRLNKFGWDYNKLVNIYTNVYMTAWLQLHLYGGIIVDYADVQNMDRNEWISCLSTLTGLNVKDLINSRDRMVRQTKPRPKILPQNVDSTVYDIENLFLQYKNQLIIGHLYREKHA